MSAAQFDLLALLMEPDPTPAPVVTVKRTTVRHFYRCCDCLSVVVSEVKTEYRAPGAWYPSCGKCGACGGAMEYMGETVRDRLVKHGMECPCDGRCTGARGPSCDCRCGGENHGTNLLVPVTYDQGGVPTLHTPADAARKGEAYRVLRGAFETAHHARYGRVIRAKQNGEYLDRGDFALYLEARDRRGALREITDLRTASLRNKRLVKLTEAMKGGAR